jgi:ribonuclease HI
VATYGFTIVGAGLLYEGRGLAVPPFHPRSTNNVAEYVGAICALEWLLRAGYAGPVVVLGDSQLVVRQFNGEYRVRKEHLKAYHERLRQLAGRFSSVKFEWVPRERNRRADELSKLALEESVTVPRRRRTESNPTNDGETAAEDLGEGEP